MGMFSAFIGGWTRGQSVVANCGETQNCYVRIQPPGSLTPLSLDPTPGMKEFGSVSQVVGRAYFSTAASSSRVFKVIGQKFYEEFSDGSSIERGMVAIDPNPAQITTNGDGGGQVAVCSGGNFYIFDLTTNIFTQVAFLNGKATQCGFASSFFLVFDLSTGTVYQSAVYDGTTFDPADFFQRNTQSDDWNGFCVTPWNQLLLPGTKTRDVYYNAGLFPVPWLPSLAGAQTEGCAAPFSIAPCGNRVAWLGTTREGGYAVYMTSGYEASIISNEAISYQLSQASQSEIAMATAEADIDQQHEFLLLTVGNNTWTFDFSVGSALGPEMSWHVRRSFISQATGALGPWRARWHCFGFNKHLWLDAQTGKSYESHIGFTTDVDGLLIQRMRISPAIIYLNQLLDLGTVELLVEPGVGNANPPGQFPQVALAISWDGGRTWGPDRLQLVGAAGDYDWVTKWEGNGGYGRKVAFRIMSTDPINNWRFYALLVDAAGEDGRPLQLEAKAA